MWLLVGLLGALFAGGLADGMLRSDNDTPDDADASPDAADEAVAAALTGDLLDEMDTSDPVDVANSIDLIDKPEVVTSTASVLPWDFDDTDDDPLWGGDDGRDDGSDAWDVGADSIARTDDSTAPETERLVVTDTVDDTGMPPPETQIPEDTLPTGTVPWDADSGDSDPLQNGNDGRDTGPDAWDDSSDVPASSDTDPIVDGTPEDQLSKADPAGGYVLGGDGNDTLLGEGGDDTLSAGMGNDLVVGGAGADELLGGSGEDTLLGGGGDDTLQGGFGDDILIAGGGEDVLFGGAGDDTIIGTGYTSGDATGTDILNGGADNDVLILGNSDIANGGGGADTFILGDWIKDGEHAVIQDFTAGEDQIFLAYNPILHPNPVLSVSLDQTTGENAFIILDGVLLAEVTGASGLTVGDILLTQENPSISGS
jgi:Ca2+-binding RTX toxin-like protein